MAPMSSIPAVSINKTGPNGKSSIGFSTGSVVVPAISETIETSWLVSAFNILDFPVFRFPKIPICNRNDLGDLILMEKFRMRKLQIQIVFTNDKMVL